MTHLNNYKQKDGDTIQFSLYTGWHFFVENFSVCVLSNVHFCFVLSFSGQNFAVRTQGIKVVVAF